MTALPSHLSPYVVTIPAELFAVHCMRKALERLQDDELGDERQRNRAYRATDVGGLYDTLPARPRVAFDEMAERLERTRRWVFDQQAAIATQSLRKVAEHDLLIWRTLK